jgi:hypothetical protein
MKNGNFGAPPWPFCDIVPNNDPPFVRACGRAPLPEGILEGRIGLCGTTVGKIISKMVSGRMLVRTSTIEVELVVVVFVVVEEL